MGPFFNQKIDRFKLHYIGKELSIGFLVMIGWRL